MNKLFAAADWKDKVSNPRQVGGIETALLDNGPSRGSRIAWINTGTGLRYKVVLDRAMDIADAFYNQYSLAWISSVGITLPQPFSNRDTEWLKTFGGGLLTTCGLTHIGGPEQDAQGIRGLHGEISNTPAELESVFQPDFANDNMQMSITGKIKQTKLFGPDLSLRRTISGTIGKAVIHIHDEIVNEGNQYSPHMLLYHFNFGWPLVDEGTDIIWNGEWIARSEDDKHIFNGNNDFKKCPGPLNKHNGSGEATAYINIAAAEDGYSICGLHNKKLGLAVAMRFKKQQLPWLTNWQHWGTREYVTGLEPGTNPPIGQSNARAKGELIELAPGESRMYDLELEVIDDEASVFELFK